MNLYPVIDNHVHLFADGTISNKVMQKFNAKYSIGFTPAGNGVSDDLLAQMDQSGIHFSVIANFGGSESVLEINKWTLEIASQHPEFIPLVSITPEISRPDQIISKAISAGAAGLKLHPMAQNFDPEDQRMYGVYGLAGELGFPVVFHCGRVSNARINSWSDPERILSVVRRFPGTVFVLTHMADSSPVEIVDFVSRYDNIYFDTSIVMSGYEPLLRVNSPSWQDDSMLLSVVNSCGSERFMFGSDYPWGSPGADLDRLKKSGLKRSDLVNIAGGNAFRLFASEAK